MRSNLIYNTIHHQHLQRVKYLGKAHLFVSWIFSDFHTNVRLCDSTYESDIIVSVTHIKFRDYIALLLVLLKFILSHTYHDER
jgi:hypothetical protein